LDDWTFYPSDKNQPIVHEAAKLEQPDDQNIRALWADLLQSVKTGQRPICDIEIGHRSTNMALLGILSLKLGRSVHWDGEQEVILHDPEANKLLSRPYRAPWGYPKG
jgi:hypothetical protein